ncbi:MAG: hypothetical protein KME59_13070 [Trichormus sp. ATA11-4-KO1]|nr:hypothetical protein [Trichormus sp. ATA11-4-KO1]
MVGNAGKTSKPYHASRVRCAVQQRTILTVSSADKILGATDVRMMYEPSKAASDAIFCISLSNEKLSALI